MLPASALRGERGESLGEVRGGCECACALRAVMPSIRIKVDPKLPHISKSPLIHKVKDLRGACTDKQGAFLGVTISVGRHAQELVLDVYVVGSVVGHVPRLALHSVGQVDRHANHFFLDAILTAAMGRMPDAHKWQMGSYQVFLNAVESRQVRGLGRISVAVRNAHHGNLSHAAEAMKRRE